MDGERLTGRTRAKAWSWDRAKREMTAWALSGLTMTEYARVQGLPVKRLWAWSGRLRKAGWVAAKGEGADGGMFAPVRVIGSRSEGAPGFEVVVGNGMTVRVPNDFVDHALRRLLEVVVSCGPCRPA